MNRFSVSRAGSSNYYQNNNNNNNNHFSSSASSSHTPKNNYIINSSPDHLSKPEPDYSILDTPSFLRDWGATLSSNPKGQHLRVPKLPTDMLLDGQAVGAPPASTAWDAN